MMALPAVWFEAQQACALLLAPALPMLAGLLILLLHKHWQLRQGAAFVGGLLLAAFVISLWPYANAGLDYTLWEWMPGLSLAFELEPLGLIFASVAGVLWPVTTVYATGYMRAQKEPNQTRFFFCFAVAIAAAQWIALSGNLLTLFIGYEVLTLSTWPLVTHRGDTAARDGGRVYLIILLTTSIGLLLPAIVWTWSIAGSTDFVAGGLLTGKASNTVLCILFALFLFGTGKAALMPFHRWLPSAMVAPAPVSALLHAVAVVKAGVFTVLKISAYIFGIDNLAETGASKIMMWVAAFTLLASSLIALTYDNLKARLAYSTVSQLAYIVLAATLASTTAIVGGALHIVTHAAAKITLFFCAGAIYAASKQIVISGLDGRGRAMPWTFGAFFVASLSIIGLPPLGGTWSKWLLLQGTLDAQQMLMMWLLLISSLLSLAYLLPIPARAFLLPPKQEVTHGEAPWACVLALCVTAAACVVLFFFAEPLIAPLQQALEVSHDP